MPVPSRRSALLPLARWSPGVGALLCLALAGCSQEGIRSYTAPKSDNRPLPESARVRLLGAIVPCEKYTWYFKLIVQESALTDAEEEAVRKFIESASFPDKGEKVDWKVPEGWRVAEAGKKELEAKGTYATVRFGPKDAPYELTVSRFPPLTTRGPNTLTGNINRWRRQLGLGEMNAEELSESGDVVKTTIGGVEAVVVDIAGIDPKLLSRGPFTYTTPEKWRELDPDELKGIKFAVKAFEVSDGDRVAVVSVSPFQGDVGGLDFNLKRWADQVEFDGDLAELNRHVRKGEVSRLPADLIDFTGPRNRVLVAWVPRKDKTWVFKMIGPADLVKAQKETFETFLKSVTFPEA